jgi:nitroreductase
MTFTATPIPDQLFSAATRIDDAIQTRMSVRAFKPDPVPRIMLTEILELAARAPSGTNAQPWKVYVLQGKSLADVVDKVCQAHDAIRDNPALSEQFRAAYDYYPNEWISPYIDRRRENGWGLYGLLGIQKGEKNKMHVQQKRNYLFFDAPVGLIFTVDKIMGQGSLLDYGCFLQNLMLAARARGLHTCPQAAWNHFCSIILPYIEAGPQEKMVCGMSLGYANPEEIINTYYTPREPVETFTRWLE